MPNLTKAYNELLNVAALLGIKAPTPAAERQQRDPLNPDGRDMRRFEREGAKKLTPALDRWRRAITRGLTTETMQQAVNRVRSESEEITRLLTQLLTEWAVAGSEQGAETVQREIFGVKQDLNFELANVAAAAWAAENAALLVNELIGARQRSVQNAISEIVRDGGTIGDLVNRIVQAGLFSPQRAEAIAVTELTRAFAQGNMIAWRESGVVTEREFRTNEDEFVCPRCGPLNEQVKPLDEPFVNENTGEIVDNPPVHVRCRCWTVPKVSA